MMQTTHCYAKSGSPFDLLHGITNELAIIGEPVKETNLIIHTLNDVGPEFKEIAATVHARNTIISFEELHHKLVDYKSFLKRDESRTSRVLSLTANNTCLSQPKNENQYQQGKKGESIASSPGDSPKQSNEHPSASSLSLSSIPGLMTPLLIHHPMQWKPRSSKSLPRAVASEASNSSSPFVTNEPPSDPPEEAIKR
ncbi:hypothetical protein LWI28_007133 [Acer negundo]|uniref:Uncharacterized protein n=1 Tax=Acer negundo TaxID=4023 RepID=A0AAD5NN49_ACENE|nr:hypothetical protein LWI28_007133 [Acer negundo]